MIESGFEIEWRMFEVLRDNIKFLESMIENPFQSLEHDRMFADEIRNYLHLLEETEPSYDLRFLVTLCSFIKETYGHLRDYKDRGLI